MKLSILIPTIQRHADYLNKLLAELRSQMAGGGIEILTDNREANSVGAKRNSLLEDAKGKYISYIDADDRVSVNYISLLMGGIEKDVDCCSLKGIITTNGIDPNYFEHSIKYREYKTNESTQFELSEIKYERYPNHLNCIKTDIAKRFRFPDKSWGEDTDWATQINQSGLLKNEHTIQEVLYYYDYVSDKTQQHGLSEI